jgi:ADP-ribosyl-[dinitrogen reductase] hydrolase
MLTAAVRWLAADAAEADTLAAAQASVSHDQPDAIAAAQAVARAVLALSRGAPVEALRSDLERAFGYGLRPETALAGGGFDVSAAGTVPAALAAALDADDWEGAVRRAVGFGDDADTLACIAGAVAEARHGIPTQIAARSRAYLGADLLAVLDRFEARRRAD